jgi:hypothetical protein
MLSTGKFWIILIVLPIYALVPDITWTIFQKVIWPNPTECVMLKRKTYGNKTVPEGNSNDQFELTSRQFINQKVVIMPGDY